MISATKDDIAAQRVELAAMLASTHDAIIGSSRLDVINSWNAAATGLYGYTAEEIIGRARQTIIAPDFRATEAEAFGRVMLEQAGGSIVTIASMSGNHVVNRPQQQVAYNASKAGVVAMTKSLAFEWATRGVRVNAVSPGYVNTPLLASKAELHAQWKAATPLGRFATTTEVAAAVGWLLSDEAAYCCGTELLMDGGYTLS